MDSRELHLQQQHQQQQHLQQQLQPLMGSFNRNPNSGGLMGHPQNHHRSLPFGVGPQYHHHQQHQQQMDQKTLESLGFDGSPSGQSQQQGVRFGIESQSQQEQQQQGGKKKRGRPRKYAPDGNIALGLAPTSPLPPSASNSYGGGEGGGGGGGGDSGGGNVNNASSDPPAKRNRGRPPGSGKKQLDALGGTGGVGFTPHVIEVKTGEDIASKVMAFSKQGPRAICILSATGAVSCALLAKGSNNGAVKCEGPYEIISLSGSFLNSESNGTMTKGGTLSVSLARPDGVIVGGNVAGMLIAGSQVQVIVGSFVVDGKKPKQSATARAQNTPEPASAPANMLSFTGGGGGAPGSPRSQGQQHSSENTSEDNESHSPLHRGNNNTNNNNHGLFGNSMPQTLHQMPMQMFWPTHNPQ